MGRVAQQGQKRELRHLRANRCAALFTFLTSIQMKNSVAAIGSTMVAIAHNPS
jgi:hypothetical protein